MYKFILFLAMLFLLPKENCFATKRLLERDASKFNFERSSISFQSCDKAIEPSKNIFNHAFPEHNQRYLSEGETSIHESKKPNTSSQASAKLDELPKNIFNHVCPDYIQRHLRVCTQGNLNKLLQLYKEAEDKNLPLAQIHLANAYHVAKSDNDCKKDFTKINEPKQLEPYGHLAQQKYFPLKRIIGKLHPDLDLEKEEVVVFDIFKKAMDQGSLYAHVVQIIEYSWNELGFFNAAQLRPLLEKGSFSELHFLYGKSLFCGSPTGSGFMYEGIKYMHKSGLLTVNFYEEVELNKRKTDESSYAWLLPQENTSSHNFEEYCDDYFQNMKILNTSLNINGLRFIGSNVILAPSKNHWKKFLANHVKEIKLSPLSTFDFLYKADLVFLGNLFKNLKIELEPSSDSNIESVIVYQKDKKLGQITVELFNENIDNYAILFNNKPKHHPPYEISETIYRYTNQMYPLIKFMETFMQNCGDGASIDRFFSSYECYQGKSLIGLNFTHS